MTPLQLFKPICPALILAALALAPAFATEVTYSTTGSFSSCGAGYTCSGTTLSGPNGLHITFAGQDAQFPNVDVPPTSYAPFGTFTTSGEIASNVTDTVAAHFTLTVAQSIPTPTQTETLQDTVSGTIRVGNSGVTVLFTSGSGDGGVATLTSDPLNSASAFKFSFGGVSYWVDQSTPIHPETCGNQACTIRNPGTSIINGAITSTVPEPYFYSLTGCGLLGLAIMAIRRRKAEGKA